MNGRHRERDTPLGSKQNDYCVLLIGTRSAESIMASGHVKRRTQTGRTHDRTDQLRQYTSKKPLPTRSRPHMTPTGRVHGLLLFTRIFMVADNNAATIHDDL